MKKFLALVLALVMTMSLVTISSSAAFVDANSIEYDEAVNVLASLGVIQGKGGNTYDPKGGVTRAEMAKMITYIKLGVAEASAFEGTTTDLTDISGHWAESFIKFCYVEGIIAGKGNGKFDPNANVTTAEAAKMLLVALGYSAGVQGYVGDQWKVAVIRDAYQNDLFEDIKLSADKALNRDEAAKIIYNTVLTNTIEQSPTLNVTTGGVSINYDKSDTTLLAESFDAYKFVGEMNAATYASSTKEYTYTDSYGAKTFEADVAGVTDVTSFVTTDDYSDLLYEQVAVIAKKPTTASKYEVLGIFSTGKSNVIQDVENAFGKESGKLKYNGTLYAVNGTIADGLLATSTDVLKYVDIDGDGDYDVVQRKPVAAAKVTYVSSTEIVTAGGAFKFADDEIADGIAKGDWVSYYSKLNGVNVVSKIDPTESVAAAKHGKYEKVEFDGSWYNVADKSVYTAGDTYRIWVLNNVIVNKEVVDGVDVSGIVMLTRVDGGEWGDKVEYMDAKGEKHTAVLDTDGNATMASPLGSLWMLKSTSKGVQLNNLPAEIGTSYDKLTAAAVNFDDGESGEGTTGKVVGLDTYKIADDAIVFVNGTLSGYAVITGAELKSVGAADAAKLSVVENEYYIKGGASGLLTRASVLALQFTGKVSDLGFTTGKEIYAYVTDTSHSVSRNGDPYVRASIWNGTENLTVYIKGGSLSDYEKGDIFVYTSIDENNVIDGITAKADKAVGTAAVYAIEGSKVILDASESTAYKTNGDTKYLYINSNASSASEIGKTEAVALQVADKYADGKIVMDNIAYVAGSEYFELVVIDVGNNMTRGNTTDVDSSADPYTDVTSTKAGDRIEFNDDVAGKAIANVLDADGKTISSAKAGQVAFATGAGAVSVG